MRGGVRRARQLRFPQKCCSRLAPTAPHPSRLKAMWELPVPYRQRALIRARETQTRNGCGGVPHCRSSKRFHTHSREVEAGTVILTHQVGVRVTEKSTGRTDTQADSGSGISSTGASSGLWGRRHVIGPHPLDSSPSIWFCGGRRSAGL